MKPVTDPIGAVARAAAERLTPEYGPRLTAQVRPRCMRGERSVGRSSTSIRRLWAA